MANDNRGLLLIDFINEIVHPNGKLAQKRGYSAFLEKFGTLEKVAGLLKSARERQLLILHVRVGFSPDYREHPATSPLFGAARHIGALQLGTWATEFHENASPHPGEPIVVKHRVSPFYGTPLEMILRNNGIHELMLCGVSTDLAVQAATREAHDRDFAVTVVADCCGAGTDADHDNSLRTLSKIAMIKTSRELDLARAAG
ncbi:MAG: cysteine hydrolase [Acidobacteria bacterium]|nr:cysteine hydrolase [Acidobacteriota bacterium]